MQARERMSLRIQRIREKAKGLPIGRCDQERMSELVREKNQRVESKCLYYLVNAQAKGCGNVKPMTSAPPDV